uniref:GNAT family N-acetyltransferase n=1 Tax=Panagrolaimus sp. PS1159 TaxID=55785 RepID=A0AC35GB05_9BILA
MLLKECLSEADFDEALNYCRRFPAFIGGWNNFLFQKTNRFPEANCRNFWMEAENGNRIYFCGRTYTFPKVTPNLSIYCDERLNIDRKTFYSGLDEIRSKFSEFYNFGDGVVVTYEPIVSEYCAWYNNRFPDHPKLGEYPCITYFMSDAQKVQLAKDYQNGIPLPEGYIFDIVDIENDSEIITKTWRHAGPGDLEHTKAKLKHFPSSLVREKSTKQPIAFEMIDMSGLCNHLFTLPEHRQKGIGSAVEKDLCLKLIRENMTPYKTVELFNEDVIASSDRSKYWTRWELNGKPVHIIYKDVPNRSFLIFCSKLTSKFDKIELWNIFDEISKLIPHIFKLDGVAAIAYGFISEAYKEWYFNRFPLMDLKDFPCCYYFMTKKQQQMLIEDFKDGIKLPDDYFFDDADIEKDAEVILNTWRHAAPGDLETTKTKIRGLPSSLVREKATNKAIAFELVDSSGFMNHLFTFPEHRNKGIGAAVEIDLCIKLIK